MKVQLNKRCPIELIDLLDVRVDSEETIVAVIWASFEAVAERLQHVAENNVVGECMAPSDPEKQLFTAKIYNYQNGKI